MSDSQIFLRTHVSGSENTEYFLTRRRFPCGGSFCSGRTLSSFMVPQVWVCVCSFSWPSGWWPRAIAAPGAPSFACSQCAAWAVRARWGRCPGRCCSCGRAISLPTACCAAGRFFSFLRRRTVLSGDVPAGSTGGMRLSCHCHRIRMHPCQKHQPEGKDGVRPVHPFLQDHAVLLFQPDGPHCFHVPCACQNCQPYVLPAAATSSNTAAERHPRESARPAAPVHCAVVPERFSRATTTNLPSSVW